MKKWILAVAILGVSAFAMAASLSDGLVAYWPFDGNANDISGNGNNGSIHGATLTTDRHGDVESAMYFGSGNYIEVANSSSLNSIGSAITIAAWVKISNWHTTGQRWAALLSKGNYQYCFNLTPDDTSYGTEVGNGVKADFTGASLLGKWVHVAVSYGSDKVCRSYINGHLYKSKSCPSGSFPVSNASLIIGKHPPQALEYFIGAMDDLFIYNRALSASEIRALQYSRPSVEFSVVTYNANSNDAEGNMPEQTFDIGEKQSLSKNKFYRDGYVFQGWAVTANGEVVYKDEELITVDSDMTLYAVWANPSMTLTAESANWSNGSITLKCEDSDTSGAEHTYSLEYCNENGTWVTVDNAQVSVTKGQNANNEEVWVVKLTDTEFSSRLGGIPPVQYHVKEVKSGRVSEPCVTRTKYGIFVSPGAYAPQMGNLSAFPSATPNYAETFGELAIRLGSFASDKVHVLTGNNAVYKKIDDVFKDMSLTVKPGDICFLYFGTHGGLSRKGSTSTRLALYNGYYEESELAEHIGLLNSVSETRPKGNGVAVIGFVHACHSKGLSDNSYDDATYGGYCQPGSWCVNNVLSAQDTAWITATDDPAAISYGDAFSLCLLSYGWEKGLAGSQGEALSCETLATYTKRRTDAFFEGLDFVNDGQNYNIEVGVVDDSDILKNIFIGKCGSNVATATPTDPIVSATGTGAECITVSVENMYNWDTIMFLKKQGDSRYWEIWAQGKEFSVYDGKMSMPDTDVHSSGRECPYYYQIRTMNSAGVGKSAVPNNGVWRVHTESHRVTFMYEAPQVTQSTSAGIWWELPYDSTLKSIWNQLDESARGLGIQGYVHAGWFTEPNGRGTRITDNTRVLKAVTYYAYWTDMTQDWLNRHPPIAAASSGDIATAAAMTAANGCRTVGECYALGINPEDPNDDLKINHFEMKDGKPVITLNHTEDGSGNSFMPRVKTLGKANLNDSDWVEVPESGDPSLRFFKVEVEMP